MRRGDVWYLRAKVPKDLVQACGREEIKKSLGTKCFEEASRRINVEAAKVQAQFDALRAPRASNLGPDNPLITSAVVDVGQVAADWFRDEQTRNVDSVSPFLDHEERRLLAEVCIDDLARLASGDIALEHGFRKQACSLLNWSMASLSDAQQQSVAELAKLLFVGENRILERRLAVLRGDFSSNGREFMQKQVSATPVDGRDTSPLSSHLGGWKAFLVRDGMKPRQVDQYVSDLHAFSRAMPKVGDVTKARLQKFSENELAGLAANTVVRKFSVIRNYWRYLKSHDLVTLDDPFAGLRLPTKKPAVQRAPWSPSQVCQLWRAALDKGDEQLAKAIRIAAFTGSRIEAICALRVEDVSEDDLGGLALHFADKTPAGHRTVPVHSALHALIAELLVGAKQNNGFLLVASSRNKYNSRSPGIGARFRRMKIALGFDETLVFHSFRRTLIGLLSKAECPGQLAADIVGHERPGMTYGLYLAKASVEEMRPWIEKAIIYPDKSFMVGALTSEPVARRRVRSAAQH